MPTIKPTRQYHHMKVVATLRGLDVKEFKTTHKWVDVMTDKEIIQRMFRNSRGEGEETRGGLLSKFGTKVLKGLYTFWEVKLEHPMTARQQLRFARACRLPYYYTDRDLLTFEKDVGVWLTMIQGNIDLMDNVLPEY